MNVDLTVGAIEETLTVTGESPIVDTQNVRQQCVITDELISALPTGRTSTAIAQLIPGLIAVEGGRRFRQDVGGLLGEGSRLVIHGGRSEDMHRLINGISTTRSASSVRTA